MGTTRPPTGGSGPLTELTVSPYVERLLPETLSPTAVAASHTPLFVSPKTVENHRGRVYTRLGIGSRRELAGSMA